MAFNFPDAPTNGQLVTVNGKTYAYNLASTRWEASGFSGTAVPTTQPASPIDGELWYNTTTDTMFVYEAAITTWVPIGKPSASGTAPTSPGVGQLWYDTSTFTLKVWTGAQWASFENGNSDLQTAAATPTTRSNGKTLAAGDLWLDTTTNSMNVWNGTAFVLVTATASAGTSEGVRALAAAPTTRANGSALQAGDSYYNTTEGVVYVYDGTTWEAQSSGNTDSQVAAAVPTVRSTGTALRNGDQYYNTTLDALFVYDADTTTWVRHMKTTGDVMTGRVAVTPVAIAGSWNLLLSNYFTIGAAAVPTPTGMVAGQAGTLYMSAAPTSWPAAGGVLKYVGGTAPAPASFPAVVPYYSDGTNVYLGNTVAGIV